MWTKPSSCAKDHADIKIPPMAYTREFLYLNFDYLGYKVQVPADSRTQDFDCLAIAHRELIGRYILL